MKDDDVFFKETQLEMNQQVISFAIPNGIPMDTLIHR